MNVIRGRMVQVVVRVPPEYERLAKEIARREMRSYASVLRQAVVEWLEAKRKRGAR